MSNNVKVVKKGEYLFKEGDKISSLILIQSGATNLCIVRPKKNIDIFPIGPSQIAGEQGLIGAAAHAFSLMATTEVKYMEIPLEAAKAQIEAAPQFLKMMIKSLSDRLKVAMTDVKGSKMEKDSYPCPDDQVAKVYGSIYHTAHHKAKNEDEKNPAHMQMEWVACKQYAQRIFGESPRRLEQACNILVKLKMCSYVMGKPIDDPDGPDEIQKIIFLDMPALESFFEFYQYYYFKGGAAAVLKYDENCANLLTIFSKLSETLPRDRFGAVQCEFPKAVEFFAAEGIKLNNGHFTQLEAKGLFAKRQARSSDGVVVLSYDVREWTTTLKIWKIILEIDKWNEKGSVDINEAPAVIKKKTVGGPQCPSCSADITATAKFCPECGTKIEAKGAPPKAA